MALTQQDLFEFGQRLKQDIALALNQQRTDIVRDIRDEMDAKFAASHARTDAKIDCLRSEILDVLSTSILPAIDAVHDRVDTLETRFDSLETRVDNLGTRVGSLETKVDHMHRDLKQEILVVRHFIHMPAT